MGDRRQRDEGRLSARQSRIRWGVFAWVLISCRVGLPAQQSGRWWYEGEIGIEGRHSESSVGGETLSEFDQQDIRLSLGLNGFLGDPGVGSFRLGLDFLFSEVEGGRVVDADRSGIDGSVQLFPGGVVPARFFYRRRSFQFQPAEETDPLSLTSLPDLSTQWGGNFRLGKKGPVVGFEGSRYEFLSSDADEETRDRQFLDWTGTRGNLHHRLRVERNRRDFGTVDLAIEDLTASFHQRVEFAGASRWEATATGIIRDVATGGIELATEDLRLRNRLLREVRERDLVDISATFGRLATDTAQNLDRYGASVFYRWRPKESWEIAPFGQFAEQTSEDIGFRFPRAGLSITWSRQGQHADVMVTSRGSYGRSSRRVGSEALSESQGALGLTASLGFGGATGLRKEVEIEHARNDIRLTSDPVLSLPDLGLPRQGLGSEDLSRARLGVSRRRASRSNSAWIEWSLRESSGALRLNEFRNETVSSTVQLGGRKLHLQISGAETRVEQEPIGEQRVRFAGLSATAQPWRGLSVRASYRTDVRDVALTPDIDTEFFEGLVRYEIGQTAIEGRIFESTQQIGGQPGRTRRGVRWSISRGLAGWLPIATGAGR